MIHELRITVVERCPISWWSAVPALVRQRRFTFEPGLNVVLGPNGSGKSTLLRLLARVTCCEQLGLPALTEEAVRPFVGRRSTAKVPNGAQLTTDGELCFYAGVPDAERPVDWDAIGVSRDVLWGRFVRDSGGHSVMRTVERVVAAACDPTVVCQVRLQRETVNETWRAALDALAAMVRVGPTAAPRRTVLLDEPDRSVALPIRRGFWGETVPALAEHLQLIIATHDALALSAVAHFIELDEGYRDKCLGVTP